MKEFSDVLNRIHAVGVREEAESYFEKYWLDEDEYFERWLPIQNSIFNSRAEFLPDMMFNPAFELFPLVGGDIFTSREDYECLKYCMRDAGDKIFVVIQNKNVVIEGHAYARFKYKVDQTWDELMSGGIVGSEHFNNGCKDYFVFGDSAVWGRYVANSWIVPGNQEGLNPVNIMGFKNGISDSVRRRFTEIRQKEPTVTPEILIAEWLPVNYR